jgi:hypothetical protein
MRYCVEIGCFGKAMRAKQACTAPECKGGGGGQHTDELHRVFAGEITSVNAKEYEEDKEED